VVATYQNPNRELTDRVDDLLSRMSLEEKVCQLGGVWSTSLHEDGVFSREHAADKLANGIGQVARMGAASTLDPAAYAELANQIQQFLLEETRLGIPAILHEEAIAGLCSRGATQFPQAIGLAATFNPDLVFEMAQAVRREMLALGARQALGPVLDIARDPRWGRLEETYGEDPYLAGRMGVAYVRGLQAESLAAGVLATGKHFLGYGAAEGGRNQGPAQIGPRELREVYAEPFAAAIREAGLESVMNSYGSVDGLACAGSTEILDGLLRGELGFRGTVVADYFSIDLLVRHHRVAADKANAAALALGAGLDVELPERDCFGEPLSEQLESGAVDEALVDRAVRRVLRQKFELGLFEAPYVDPDLAREACDAPAHRALAARLAEQSVVLLKNDGVLPLSKGCTVALLGPTADEPRLLQGDYSYPAHAEMAFRHEAHPGGRAPVAGTRSESHDTLPCVRMVTPREALSESVAVRYARGCTEAPDAELDLGAIDDALAGADVAVICVGGRSGLTADCASGEFRDASSLSLPAPQRALIDRVADRGLPVVVVVIGGRAYSLEAEAARAGALMMAWLPGEEAGAALADLLIGRANPSGRLPVSLAANAGQLPVHYGHRSGGGASAIYGDYTDASSRALFCFGHGLSYSSFEYGELECPDTVDTHSAADVKLVVSNSSDLDGEEVVQLYVRDTVADVARPVRQLVGFQRIALAAGERKRITFRFDVTQLAYFNGQLEYVVDPGQVELMAGASSADIRSRRTLMVSGEKRVLKQQQRLATQAQVSEV
jgi:beta-glucosidase